MPQQKQQIYSVTVVYNNQGPEDETPTQILKEAHQVLAPTLAVAETLSILDIPPDFMNAEKLLGVERIVCPLC